MVFVQVIRRFLAATALALLCWPAFAQSPASGTIYTGQFNGQTRSGPTHSGVCSALMAVAAESDSSIVKYSAYMWSVGNGPEPYCAFQTVDQSGDAGKYGVKLSVSQGCTAGVTQDLTFMSGWGYTPTDATGNSVPGSDPGLPPDPYCDASCSWSYGEVQTCHIEQDAGPNGYYKYTCTYTYTSTGSTCTVQTDPPTSPEPTDPNNGPGDSGGGDPDPDPDGDPNCGGDGQPTCNPDPDGDPTCGGEGQPACGSGGDPDGDPNCGGEGQPACGTGGGTGTCGGEGQPACCPTGQTSDGNGGCVSTGGGTPGDGTTPEGEDCPAGSTLARCSNLTGVPGEDGIGRVTKNIGFTPDNVLGTNGSCPADRTVSVMGRSFTITNMSWLCGLLTSYVRPMAIILATIFAIGIVAGATKD